MTSPSPHMSTFSCKIFMVGFPTILPDSTLSTVVDMVGHLVPEASVIPCELLDPSENASAESGGRGTDISLPVDWILTEATSLLGRMRESAAKGEEIILSGHGLGGIVAKQAVMTANAKTAFYQLASQISSLIFFDVPHESADHQPWEGLLVNLIKTTPSAKLRNSLYSTVSRLARRVSELSTSFSRFEPKYRIMNVVPHYDHGQAAPVGASAEQASSWLNSLQCAVQWPATGDIGGCNVEDIPSLQLLRTCFTPTWNTSSVDPSPFPHRPEYFDALKILSPSTRIIYESMAPDAVDTMRTLKAVYDTEFQRCEFAAVRGGIVHVMVPDGRGMSAVVKLFSRHLQAQASLVVIDNFPGPSSDAERPTAFYRVMVSTLHQILSQKPSLLTPPVQMLMDELLQRDAWAEGVVQHLLSVLLTCSRDTDYLIVVHDYGSSCWPDVARQWWSGLVAESSEIRRSGSACTLLLSGTGPQDDKCPSGINCHRLDLTDDYRQKKEEFIRKECARILAEVGSASSDLLQGERGIDIQNEIVTRVLSFPGSFGEIGCYLGHLLRGLTLSTPRAILQSIGPSPKTADEFYRSQIAAVLHGMDDQLLSWTTAVLSWVSMATRPLQAQELAAAVAIDLNQEDMSAMDEAVTLDMEGDIHKNLAGLLYVENGYVRIASPTAKAALGASDAGTLKLMGDDELVLRCLHYLTMALGQQPARRVAETAFVDYAVRSWPAHFLRIVNPDEFLCRRVAEFLGSSRAANRWFRLYAAGNDYSQSLSCPQDPECHTPRDKLEDLLGLTPAEMASHAGLWPMMLYLLAENDDSPHDSSSLPKMLVRRGGLVRQMVFFDGTGSKLQLECAIASDDIEAVKALVDGLDRKTIDSYCPLHLAAFMGSPQMLMMLLDKKNVQGSGKNTDKRGRTALHMAALGGRRKILELLQVPLGEGNTAIYTQKDKNSETALLLATRAGNVTAAKLLIDFADRQGLLECLLAGSTVNELTTRDQDGLTLLHLAARYGCVEAVETVLKAALAEGSVDMGLGFSATYRQLHVPERLGEMPSEIHRALRRAVERLPRTTRASAFLSITGDEIKRFTLPQTLPEWGGHSSLLLYPLVHGQMTPERDTAENRDKELWDLLFTLSESLRCKPAESFGRSRTALSRRFRRTEDFQPELLRLFSRIKPPTYGRVMLATDKEGRLPLHHAAENGQREVVGLLIQGMNGFLEGWGDLMRKHRDSSGNAPGDLAAGRGHIDVLEALYPGKSPVDASLLSAAAGTGQLLVVKHLLQRDMHPDGEPESGRTPLGLASAGGFGQVVRSLLRSGADVNLPSRGRQTPLYLAVQHKRYEVVEILLGGPRGVPGHSVGGGASTSAVMVEIPDSSRQTPLHVAASAGDERLIKLLLSRGANVDSRSSKRQTPLHLAVRDGMQQAAHLLVHEYGASLTALDQNDKHPVWYAIDSRDPSMVKALLLSAANDLEGGDPGARYPLEFQRRDLVTAVEKSALEVVDFLLKRFSMAAQDITDGSSDSLLHIAARGSNAGMVSQLLSVDTDPNLAGSGGRTPLHVAAASGNLAAVKALLGANADLSRTDNEGKTPLLLACVAEKDAPENCKALLDGGATVNDHGRYKTTPLFEASYHGQTNVVRVLLDSRHGADVNWHNIDSWSSLHAAADNSDICQMLIAAGADINYQKVDGWAPLHMACAWKEPETVKCLLENGAGANLRSHAGETPLHIAVSRGMASVVGVMLDHGHACPDGKNSMQRPGADNVVDVRARTTNGLTCLDIATRNACANLFATLLEAAEWDYQDLVRPYWHFIEQDMVDPLKPLIRKDGRLLSASRLDGHDGMPEEPEHGNNVSDGTSPQAAIEREQVILRLLHLAIDCHDKDLWDTLAELDARDKIPRDTHDKDGWTLDDFMHQAQPGMEYIQAPDGTPVRGITQNPGAVLFPKGWAGDKHYGSRMDIEGNGLEVTFEKSQDRVCLRGADDDATIAIGFCSEFSDTTAAHTGWRRWSVGYHSNDGRLYEESESSRKTYKTYGLDSTVGCGIDYAEGKYFFTLNGHVIIEKESSLIYRKIYPCLSHSGGKARVYVNFGLEEFMWAGATSDEEMGEGAASAQSSGRYFSATSAN